LIVNIFGPIGQSNADIGAWGIGIGAFLIALTFKPFPKTQLALAG